MSWRRVAGGEREFFMDNLLIRIHFIIMMTRWTGLAPCEFEFPFPGSLTSTFLMQADVAAAWSYVDMRSASSLLLSSLELCDTKVYEP